LIREPMNVILGFRIKKLVITKSFMD